MNKKQKRDFYERIEASVLARHHKDFVYGCLREVLTRKPDAGKIKRVRTKSPLMRLEAWEALKGGPLAYPMLAKWVRDRKLCPVTVQELIEEFRIEMLSKGKEYADFVATFQTYINKGYTSKQVEQILWLNSPHRQKGEVKTMTSGASI